jgi:hypothetical protein
MLKRGLARPLYVSTQEMDEGDPVFAFPWIRSGWEGVCLPHSHWVGIREELARKRTDPFWMLAKRHEVLGHWLLADAILPKMIRRIVGLMLVAIAEIGHGRQGVILDHNKVTFQQPAIHLRVPLAANAISNILLERLWGHIKVLHLTAMPVEEVWAVWISLRCGEDDGSISPKTKTELVRRYRKKYGPDFASLYDDFDKVGKTMSGNVAVLLAAHSMNTLTPVQALREMLEKAQDLLAQGKSLDKTDLEHLCSRIVDKFLSSTEIESFDPIVELRNIDFIDDPGPRSFWAELPEEPLYFRFSKQGLLYEGPPIKHPDDILLESVFEQLTSGLGLVCPFFGRGPMVRKLGCCGMYQPLLRAIFEHTQGPTRTWMPQGCLKA